MNNSVLEYCKSNILPEWIAGKAVLEVGSQNVNGSCQQFVKAYGPAAYTGIDIQEGPGVDLVLNANQLIDRFGYDRFDFILSNECVEHVEDWKKVFSNIKNVLKPGGIAMVTTRSKGFGYHAWPYDFWRYEKEDMRQIFRDMEILDITDDWEFPGIFVTVKKPLDFKEASLDKIKLYSIVKWKRLASLTIDEVKPWDIRRNLFLYRLNDFRIFRMTPAPVKKFFKKWLLRH